MTPDDPRMTTVECGLDQYRYALGQTGIQIAESWINTGIEVLLTVREWRAKDPAAFPNYGDATPEETARRILARLLDAGWRPPDSECLDLPNGIAGSTP